MLFGDVSMFILVLGGLYILKADNKEQQFFFNDPLYHSSGYDYNINCHVFRFKPCSYCQKLIQQVKH